jgi:serine/threonine protein kinase
MYYPPLAHKHTDHYVTSQAKDDDDDDTMSAVRSIGQRLQGRSDLYTLGEKLHESVWKATCVHIPAVSIQLLELTIINSGSLGGNVIVKSVNHFRLQNERDVLLRFQPRTPHIRPLLDEVDPDTPSHALIMRWLDNDLLNVTKRRQLASSEVKFVAKGVLEALQALHADGYVHTGKLERLR